MNGNDTNIKDFETLLRGELRRRADQLVIGDPPGCPRPHRQRRRPVLGAVAAGAVVAIAMGAAVVTNHLGTGSATHLRTQSSVPTTGQLGQGPPLHFTLTQPGIRLRAAQNLHDAKTTPKADTTFSIVTYRMPGELRPPIVYATLARTSDQALPSDPQHHPLYHALNVAGRSGDIVWLGTDVADLVVPADDAHTLDLSAWGLTQDQLVNVASSVVVHSDTSFELPGLPAGLQAMDAAPSSIHGGWRAEFSLSGESLNLWGYPGGLEPRLGVLLYPGSGTQLGSTTIKQVSVDGTLGLVRIDLLESPNSSAGQQALSFHAVWELGRDQSGELFGGASNTTAISDILNTVAPIDEHTWQEMVAAHGPPASGQTRPRTAEPRPSCSRRPRRLTAATNSGALDHRAQESAKHSTLERYQHVWNFVGVYTVGVDMKRIVGILVLAVMCGACSNGNMRTSPPTTASAAPTSPTSQPVLPVVVTRLELPSPVVVAGLTAHGALVIENRTGKPLRMPICAGWEVQLTNRSVPIQRVFFAKCGPGPVFPVGEHRYPFTVRASYRTCGATSGRSCLNGAVPPLPVGEYHAGLVQYQMALPQPASVPMRVVVDG